MKNKPETPEVAAGSAAAFFERSLARARQLDAGSTLAPEMRLTFEDPADLLKLLTVQRLRVLRAVRHKPAPLSELARTLKRDRAAVRRDVSVLVSFGLVKAHEEPNPGHGRRKVIEPLASKFELVATI
jgi:predicted transcriptional regulator